MREHTPKRKKAKYKAQVGSTGILSVGDVEFIFDPHKTANKNHSTKLIYIV